MDFTPWTLLTDVGIVSLLLLIGKFLRAKVRIIQRLFIPPSLLAGFTALLFGPEGLGWLPLSGNSGTYAGILIAMVFSTLPLTSSSTKKGNSEIGRMWAYSQTGMLLQWALGGGIGIFLLSRFWKINDAFGLSMPAGFCGGHGTAAALGQAFAGYNVPELLTLAMTAATVGIIASVIIGMWLVTYGSEKGYTKYLTRFAELPAELRTGILPEDKRHSMGNASFSAISLDSMTFNFGLVAAIALGGYGISKGVALLVPGLSLPVFSCAFLVGILIKWIIGKSRIDQYVSKPIVGHLGGAFTDYLVVFGVASIKVEIVAQYIVPLLILLAVGLLCTLLYVFLLGKRFFKDAWFEKSMFTWGWFTGTTAMGLALLRITDPDSKSGCLDQYAMAYLYIAPVEIALVTFSPMLFAGGFGGIFVGVCAIAGAGILLFSKIRKWI